MKLLKAPSQQCLGVFVSGFFPVFFSRYSVLFFLFIVNLTPSVLADCGPAEALEWVQLERIVDGDTLRLVDGRKVRVIAINTPELARASKPAQAFAQQAKLAAKEFFSNDSKLAIEIGVDKKDRYGRVLAHVYRADGKSLSAHLLAKGLAWQVVVPPNDSDWQCFAKLEKQAYRQSIGLWSHQAYAVKSALNLTLHDVGFQRVEGVVRSVNRSRKGWWLQVDTLAVYIRYNDMTNFPESDPSIWLNSKVTLRGWIVDRSQSAAVKKQGFSPLMMNLRHQGMKD